MAAARRAGEKRQRARSAVAAPALDLLAALPRFAGCDFVFTTGRRPIGALSARKRKLDARIAELNGGVPIAPYTWHDLRRSAASGMAALGIAPHVIESILNHRSGVISGMRASITGTISAPRKRMRCRPGPHTLSGSNMVMTPAMSCGCAHEKGVVFQLLGSRVGAFQIFPARVGEGRGVPGEAAANGAARCRRFTARVGDGQGVPGEAAANGAARRAQRDRAHRRRVFDNDGRDRSAVAGCDRNECALGQGRQARACAESRQSKR